MKIHNFDQRSDEWFKIRLGKFTGSDINDILGKGETRNNIIAKKAFEVIANKTAYEEISNQDIERGKELENAAIFEFEMQTELKVQNVGFIEDDENSGCSPDGLIQSNNSIVEVKAPRGYVFLKYMNSDIDKKHYAQMQYNMLKSQAIQCYYILYNEDLGIYYKIVKKDDEFCEKIKSCLETAIKDKNEIIKKYYSINQKDIF